MLRWYHDAVKCYVYLSDVSVGGSVGKPAFKHSRWFTRGWTLQELLAPTSVEFFSVEPERLGDGDSVVREIHDVTGIAIRALQGSTLSQFSIGERMSWAERRETKREEDAAYCLLGIFDIPMPLIYDEGRKKALIRLQKEIKESWKYKLPTSETQKGPARKEKEIEILKCLNVSPYRDRKDRNPDRVPGTCDWFVSHELFRGWQESISSRMLWASADPGCRKSVLAKYLVDSVLLTTESRTVCYFFFKNDFED
ncbi:hypothetical protein K469DRAFT_813352 [Zopfia rhizophila CBS 207.26]|uniref:Nephrocystin 3-like N-terminal domain-containing protein n=1 Tax=Zopfia rhizophila CBS 207.26 TaxID=1314779 RepID=A0A6A6DFY0_9PEZI|nr:hypothetical protein K469DRAFT_813352 [Zopfia rhizophila CBS 207.26]